MKQKRTSPPEDGEFENLELGSGNTDFGTQYFPLCCLTEKDEVELLRRSPSHHIDYFFNAYQMPSWTQGYFNKVILCNPYNFGFRDQEDCQPLVSGIINALKQEGKIIVIGSAANPWSRPNKVKKAIEYFKSNSGLNINTTEVVESFDSNVEFPGFRFFNCDGSDIVIPNTRIIIDVVK